MPLLAEAGYRCITPRCRWACIVGDARGSRCESHSRRWMTLGALPDRVLGETVPTPMREAVSFGRLVASS